MSLGKAFEGSGKGAGLRIAVVTARFNAEITERMRTGAREGLRAAGVGDEDVDEAYVPGAFELPLAAKRLAEGGRYDAVICIGAVIQGETSHDTYVAGQAAAGIQRAALDTGVPIIFGVITTNTRELALDRAGGRTNKGADAAATAIAMATLLRALGAQ